MNVSKELLERLNGAFAESEAAGTDVSEWLDDANDYSIERMKRIEVDVTGFDSEGEMIRGTSFNISPKQARAMFFAIAGAQE